MGFFYKIYYFLVVWPQRGATTPVELRNWTSCLRRALSFLGILILWTTSCWIVFVKSFKIEFKLKSFALNIFRFSTSNHNPTPSASNNFVFGLNLWPQNCLMGVNKKSSGFHLLPCETITNSVLLRCKSYKFSLEYHSLFTARYFV